MPGPADPSFGAHRSPWVALLVGLATLVAASTPSTAAGAPPAGGARALLINGGSKPAINFLSHFHHLEQMVAVLRARGVPADRIDVFSADGENPDVDLATRDALPAGFWLIEGLEAGDTLRPPTQIVDTKWKGVKMRPARRKALEDWFGSTGQTLTPDDWLLLFVTDHGTGNDRDPDNGAISLWQEKLTVRDLAGLLRTLPPWVRTVMVMSQCYSGTFAAAMYEDDRLAGNVCGFFSTARDLKAYGCYPEGRDRDQIGHAFQFIDALQSRSTVEEAHREVLVMDDTPDVPLRTSDLHMGRLLAERAGREGVGVESLTDRLLAKSRQDPSRWESQFRLLDRIGDAYGMFSPRSVSDLARQGKDLESAMQRMVTYAERWQSALQGVKTENLESFLRRQPQWRGRLKGRGAPDAARRQSTLAELLPLLEAHARDGDAALWTRLTRVKERAEGAREAAWRLDVRGAVLHRMRSILEGVAGRIMLGSDQPGLAALLACESLSPGDPPEPQRIGKARRFPRLIDDIGLLEQFLPSWLGVRFGRLRNKARAGRDLPEGATVLEAVFPDSPASEAGLIQGDIVLGPPGRPFGTTQQLREWTMTSPTGTPLELEVLRPGKTPESDRVLRLSVTLRPFPEKWPELTGSPASGEEAPAPP